MGSLRETPLPALLVGLQRDAFSGSLALARGPLEKRFAWRRGAPVGVVSPLAAERLSEILAADGALAAGARARVEQALAKPGTSELHALASAGGVAPRVLVLALAEQLRRSLSDCLGWREGAFRLEPDDPSRAAPALPFDLLALVAEEVARGWPLHEILVALGPHATSFPRLVPGTGAPWLADAEARARLFARLDGRSASFALLHELADPRCAAAFWILDVQGALVHRDEPAPPPGEAAAPEAPEIEVVVREAPGPLAPARSAHAGAKGPAAVAAAPPSDELRREIRALHARLGSLDLWQVLGVARDADVHDVRRAYLRAAKRLHPDRLVQLGLADCKAEANEVFAEIARAHEVLSDPERRRLYEEEKGVTLADADRIAEAEAAFRRGDVLLRAGNFRAAVELLERATLLWPEEAEYQAALAWALHRKTPPESARAWQHFERALALGEQALWLLRASLVARELGHDARAAELAARARALDPHVRA